MADLIYDIQVKKDQAQKNLDELQKSVARVNDAFNLLKTAIGAIALGNIISQAVQFADAIQDVSDSTGVAIDKILGFSSAVLDSGGNADSANKAIFKLVDSIGAAAGGSLELQNAFRAVGVTLKDLRTLSEQDILKKTIKGLGDVADKSEQSILKTKLLGKEFRTVAVEGLADKFDAGTASSGRYASAITAAADAQGSLESNMRTFQLTLLKILEPLNKIVGAIKLTGDAFSVFIMGLGAASIALGAFLVASAPVTAVILGIAGAAALLGTAWSGLSEYIDKMKGIVPPPPPLSDADIAKAEQEAKALRDVIDALEKRRAEISRSSVAYKRQNNDIIDSINLEKSLIGKSKEFVEIERAREAILKRAGDESQKLRDAKALLGKEEQALAATYDAQIAKISKAAQVDADRVTRSLEGLQSLRMIEQGRLQDIENTNNALQAQIDRQQQLAGTLRGANDQRVDMRFGESLQGLSPLRKQIAEINEAARKSALEAGRAFAETFPEELTTQVRELDDGTKEYYGTAVELAKGLDQISNAYKGIADEQIKSLGLSDEYLNGSLEAWEAWTEEFKVGTKDAFTRFKEDAMDAGKQASDSFGNFTSGMEDAFVEFAKTGKLSFKSLADSIIADLIRIAVRKAIVAAIGGPLGSLFGFANGGAVMGGTPIIVGERGPELFVPQAAGKIVSNSTLKGSGENNSSMGGGQTVVNYNIQAVDASSFRSLVAKDPSFIYAVTEQGRRSQPTRSR